MTTDAAIPGGNEDAAGVLGEVAVVLDGAGVPARYRAGCDHSVAWFSHTLASQLLERALDRSVDLRAALAEAICDVRNLHEDDCDLDAGGPSATVVAVRVGAEQLEYLVLCDSSLLLVGRDGAVHRVSDTRIDEVVRAEVSSEAVEARRNHPGGFWVARHEPEAADEAITGVVPLADLRDVHLVSDGVTRSIDLLAFHTPQGLAQDLAADPAAVLARLRAGEQALPAARRPRKIHDDATVVTLAF